MGSGKSRLAEQIAKDENAVLISEDDLLSKLYANKVKSVSDYKQYSDKLKLVVRNVTQQILNKGITVVLDFPANTKNQRLWLRSVSDEINAGHICYFVERTNEVCIRQLLQRGNPNTDTEEMFYAINKYFKEPSEEESINIVKV